MSNNNYGLVRTSLSYADDALAIFKRGLSPTSLHSIAERIAKHTAAMLAAEPDCTDLIPIIIGLLLKQTCDKEVQAFLKAEKVADAEED